MKSKIPNAGDGLFAVRPFKVGEEVARYGGVIKDKDDDYNRWYTVETADGKYLDHSSTQAGLARWVNDCRPQNRPKYCKGENTQIRPTRDRRDARLVATKRIHPYDEIFTSYGRDYWN